LKTVIIVAVAANGVIGKDGDLAQHHPADLRHFVRTTKGYPVVAGRKTFESFKQIPLPERENIVLTRDRSYDAPEGVLVVHSFDDALEHCLHSGADRMFVLGGGEVYHIALPHTDEMIITHFPEPAEGDTYFPEWNAAEWDVVDTRREKGLTFSVYRRKAV
jgi:dihydrofolate reductase